LKTSRSVANRREIAIHQTNSDVEHRMAETVVGIDPAGPTRRRRREDLEPAVIVNDEAHARRRARGGEGRPRAEKPEVDGWSALAMRFQQLAEEVAATS
jgi:hypothetical protein